MDLKELLGAGGVGGTFAAVADVVVTGGDVVFWLMSFAVDQGPLLYVLLARLSVIAPEIPWLPTSRIESALMVVAAVVALLSLYRLIKRLLNSWRSNNAT